VPNRVVASIQINEFMLGFSVSLAFGHDVILHLPSTAGITLQPLKLEYQHQFGLTNAEFDHVIGPGVTETIKNWLATPNDFLGPPGETLMMAQGIAFQSDVASIFEQVNYVT